MFSLSSRHALYITSVALSISMCSRGGVAELQGLLLALPAAPWEAWAAVLTFPLPSLCLWKTARGEQNFYNGVKIKLQMLNTLGLLLL